MYLYEELIRRFSELSHETAGEHFTPREVIRLMVNLLFIEDEDALTKPGIVRTVFDPACGTGGMLSVAEDHLRELNPAGRLEVFGQELNAETYAICRSDMMLKGQDASHIKLGNSFSEDGHEDERFDYLLANPPFGVEWKKVEDAVRTESETKGFAGRFGAGLPRINDGSFLFLQHMISKMKPASQGGSRVAIVFNGSPLFTGAAGSGESEIRRWIIENDWLKAVIALPDQLFYNTGISTYFWIVTNRKSPERRGKVQLVDAREFWVKMRKSLGDKRKEISAEQIAEITRLYGDFIEDERVKIFPNEAFGYLRITVERLDLENNLIHVENGWDREEGLIQPKSAAGVRDVPIIPTLRDLLVKWKLGRPWSEGLVFGRTTTNPFDPSTIHARARKVWSEAGLPSLSLHEARHSYASMLIAAGDAPRSIMELMGHSSITVTYDTYGKLFLGTHASSGDRLQTYIDAASNPVQEVAVPSDAV